MAQEFVYKCCPAKNKECKKSHCQTLCTHTLNKKYSCDGKAYIFNRTTMEFEEAEDE